MNPTPLHIIFETLGSTLGIVLSLFTTVALLAIYWGIKYRIKELKNLKNTVKTTATFKKTITKHDSDGTFTYAQYAYTWNGEEKIITGHRGIGGTNVSSNTFKQTIYLQINTETNKAIIDSYFGKHAASMALTIIGSGFLFLVLSFIYLGLETGIK